MAALLAVQVLVSCGGGGGGGATQPPPVCVTPCGVTISWSANPELAVAQAGGGYRVYVAASPGVILAAATRIDVPFDPLSGSTPTSATLQLTAGDWYVRVAAFSALNPAGSAPSAELVVAVP
ncbi:MAG: hypothetical protein R3298_10385 [Gammaproteobacteria bacterium]|nr:hypothetical protein [Gammaproteobacteria bacterium]